MRRHRHRRHPSLARLCGRAFAKCAAFTVSGLLVVIGGTGMAQVEARGEPRTSPWVEQTAPAAVTRLMERFDCSSVGYGEEVVPRSAIVREPGGRLDVVTFDEGWAAYTADGGTELVAVCLRPVRG